MLMFILSTFAFAQSPENTQPVEYAKETIVDFIGAEVDGNVVKPQMSFVTAWQPAREGSLLTLRTSFDMEMAQSIDNIK